MAQDKSEKSVGSNPVDAKERTRKAQATRAITAAKVAKLSGENHYAYTKMSILRHSLEQMQARLLDGGSADADLAEACGELDKRIGCAMFN